MKPAQPPVPQLYHPVYLHSRREALVVFCIWLGALLWAVPYCYLNGYGQPVDPERLATVWGIPSWLFWGVGLPWMVANLLTTWFCFCYMEDDDLGESPEERQEALQAEAETTGDRGAER